MTLVFWVALVPSISLVPTDYVGSRWVRLKREGARPSARIHAAARSIPAR
jgi:hypothetical protein